MAYDDSIREAFGEWLALPDARRAEEGEPTTIAAWGRKYDVASKTLSRWKNQPDPVVEAARDRAAKALHSVDNDDITAVAQIKEGLIKRALNGNKKDIDQFMSYFGKDAIKEEKASRLSGLKDMTDEELNDKILTTIGVDAVQGWLEGQGL